MHSHSLHYIHICLHVHTMYMYIRTLYIMLLRFGKNMMQIKKERTKTSRERERRIRRRNWKVRLTCNYFLTRNLIRRKLDAKVVSWFVDNLLSGAADTQSSSYDQNNWDRGMRKIAKWQSREVGRDREGETDRGIERVRKKNRDIGSGDKW